MKIAVRGGHNNSVTGTSQLLNEVKEDRKVKDAVIKYLKELDYQVLDVTSPDSCNTQGKDLAYGVNKATDFGAELFISIHFNNAYKTYDGALGTETIIYPNSKTAYPYAKRINDNLVKLGFKNRGVKNDSRGLYELNHTKCPACIIEVCFVEATTDVKLYKQLGVDKVAKAIAEGIVGHSIEDKKSQSSQIQKKSNNTPKKTYSVNYCLEWQKFYNEATSTKKPLILNGIYCKNTQNSLDSLLYYIKQSKKYKYCLEFQRFYNSVTQTRKPISEDGYWGKQTENAYFTMVKLIKGEY